MKSDAGFNRDRAVRLVSLVPGIHLRELQRVLGISFNSARYNVEKLCSRGEIVGQKEKGYFRLYPTGTKECERVVYSLLRSRALRKVLLSLSSEPGGLTQKQLGDRTSLAKSTVSESLQRLTERGVVAVNFSNDLKPVYALQNSAEIFRILMSAGDVKPASATERFIDLWDF